MGVAVAFADLLSAFIRVRVRGLLMPLRPVVRMGMLLDSAMFVMRQCHALHGRDRRHALDRNDEGQQHHSNKPEESLRHPQPFYAKCFGPGPTGRFPGRRILARPEISCDTFPR